MNTSRNSSIFTNPNITLSLWIVVFALFVADILSTDFVITHGGFEVNPFMQSIASNLYIHTAVKSLFLIYLAIVIKKAEKLVNHIGILFLIGVCLIYLCVVVNNLSVIFW